MRSSERWTASDIPDLRGKTAVITGGNSGVGFETAVELARHGATTIITCRSVSRGESALGRIKESAPSAQTRLMLLDLGDLASIDAFVESFTKEYENLDLLINNAGIMATPYRTTKDGFESQFGTNHLGHFVLTGKLLPLLINSPASRVVNVSSLAHRGESIDFELVQVNRENYNRWRAYGRSKLANLLFTYQLQRRLESTGITHVKSLAAHPGLSRTNIAQGLGWMGRLLMPIAGAFFQSARMGALPILRAATDPQAVGGQYYGPDGKNERKGYPVLVSSSSESHDESVAKRLWTVSEEMTSVTFSV